jgi:hypothetical protein
MLRGGMSCSQLQDGKKGDGASPLREQPVTGRTLHLRDQGFINLPRWQQEQEQEQFVLRYLRSTICLFDRQGQPLDLVQMLSHAEELGEREVVVGSSQRVPMRLVCERVPAEVAKQRRKRGRQEARERGQASSKRASILAQWTIAVTTVPSALLSLPEALVLLRLRWHIEWLFTLWKQHGSLDEWRTGNPTRMLCEIYAKLIGLLIQQWLLVISCWHLPDRSLVKAAKAVRCRVVLLSAALEGDLPWERALGRIQRVVQAGARLNSRQDAPNTCHLVSQGFNQWSSKPRRPWKAYRKHKQKRTKKKLRSSSLDANVMHAGCITLAQVGSMLLAHLLFTRQSLWQKEIIRQCCCHQEREATGGMHVTDHTLAGPAPGGDDQRNASPEREEEPGSVGPSCRCAGLRPPD